VALNRTFRDSPAASLMVWVNPPLNASLASSTLRTVTTPRHPPAGVVRDNRAERRLVAD
jgi:hypothetical protein